MNNQYHLSFAVKGHALEPRLRNGDYVIVAIQTVRGVSYE